MRRFSLPLLVLITVGSEPDYDGTKAGFSR
jgi:hypothetical protein